MIDPTSIQKLNQLAEGEPVVTIEVAVGQETILGKKVLYDDTKVWAGHLALESTFPTEDQSELLLPVDRHVYLKAHTRQSSAWPRPKGWELDQPFRITGDQMLLFPPSDIIDSSWIEQQLQFIQATQSLVSPRETGAEHSQRITFFGEETLDDAKAALMTSPEESDRAIGMAQMLGFARGSIGLYVPPRRKLWNIASTTLARVSRKSRSA